MNYRKVVLIATIGLFICVTGLLHHRFLAKALQPPAAIGKETVPAGATPVEAIPGNRNSCLARTGPLITISGKFTSPYRNDHLAPASRIDARLAKWSSPGQVAFRIGGGENVCVQGGEIIGDYDLSTSWAVMHDTYGLMIRGGTNYLLTDIRIHNYGDGVFIGREANDGFVIRGAYLSQSLLDHVWRTFLG